MIEHFLRRFSVRSRLIAGYILFLAALVMAVPVIWSTRNTVLQTVEQIVSVDSQVERLLLRSATRIAASRTDLTRYVIEVLPTTAEALGHVSQAEQSLQEAVRLIEDPQEQAAIEEVIRLLSDYRDFINEIEGARERGDDLELAQLGVRAGALGGELDTRIDQRVRASEARVRAHSAALNQQTRGRFTVVLAGFGGAAFLSLALALLVERSITRPIHRLRYGTEAFGAGQLDARIPVEGEDDLAALADAFNGMAVQVERTYQELEARVNARTEDLARRNAYLQAALDVSRATADTLDLQVLMQTAVERIRGHFDLYYVGLFLLDGEEEWVVLQAGTGEAGRRMVERRHRIQVGKGMIGWSVVHAQPRVALTVEEDLLRLATPELPETRAEAALPLRARGQVIGALTVQAAQPDAFDEAMLSVLEVISDQLASAIDAVQLYRDSRASLEALERLYGEASRTAWRDLIQEQMAPGFRSERGGVLAVDGAWPAEMRAALERRDTEEASVGAIVTEEAGSTLVIPLEAHGAAIGALRLCKGTRPWSSREQALVAQLSEQLTIALESARLYQDTRRRAAQERLVGDISSKMRNSLEVDRVLYAATQEIGAALGLNDLTIVLEREELLSSTPEEAEGGNHD